MIYLIYTDVIKCILESELTDAVIRAILDDISELPIYEPESEEVMVKVEVN